MTDLIPHTRNRLANGLNLIFHPTVICIPTLLILLWDQDPVAMLMWAVVALVVLLIPSLSLIVVLKRRGRETYQRATRTPIYAVGMASILLNLLIFRAFDAPDILTQCFLALLLWLPLQWAINSWITKISVHSAVLTGCVMGLWLAGKLPAGWGIMIGVGCILVVGWARYVSQNHTRAQILLGVLVGGAPVALVFGLLGM